MAAPANDAARTGTFRIQRVDAETAPLCRRLTHPLCHAYLDSVSADGPELAWCYKVFGTPLGLILAHFAATGSTVGEASIVSISVDRTCRNQGVATALLERAEYELRLRGCSILRLQYDADNPHAPSLEKLLRKAGWESPKPFLLICRILGPDFHRFLQDPWVQNASLPSPFTIFPWNEVTADEWEKLQEMPADSDDYLPPEKGPYEPLNSLGLRHRREIIGWMLTRRISPGLILYDDMYVRKTHQRMGRAIAVLAEALKRHYAQERELPTVGAYFRTRADNDPMVRFVYRRMGPYLSSVKRKNSCVKHLGTNPKSSF